MSAGTALNRIARRLNYVLFFALVAMIFSANDVSADTISACGNLSTENTIYTLDQDVNSSGTCFTIEANNITLDGAGHIINFSNYSFGYAINNTGAISNFTVKNARIVLANSSVSVYNAIYLDGVSGATILNNTLNVPVSSFFGVIQISSSSGTIISNNTVNSSGADATGIYLLGSNSSILSNNTISVPKIGIDISGTSNTVLNNSITTTAGDGYGIRIGTSSQGSNISGNAITSGNAYSIYVTPSQTASDYNQSIDTTNTANGKPIYYYFSSTSATIQNTNNVGLIYAANSTNITIRNVTLTRDGIIFALTNNSQIIDSNISVGNNSYGVYLYSASLNNISNNTIRAATNTDDHSVFLSTSSNSNILSNNTIFASGTYAYGAYIAQSSTNTFLNNTITTSGAGGRGISLDSSSSNTFLNNTILASGATAPAVYISSSTYNSFTGGSIISQQDGDYALYATGTTNTFTSTNITALRRIYFDDATSYFNYNETNSTVVLETNVSAQSYLNRTLITWSNATMQWNDTNTTSGVVANYTLTGLLPSTAYYIYNTSGGVQNKSYTLTTDSGGILPSFNITLNGTTSILVDSVPAIMLITPSANNTYLNATAVPVFNLTTSEAVVWCKFSLNGTANRTMDNTSQTAWNYTNSSLGFSEGLNNVVFFCNDSRGNIGNSSVKYYTRDTVFPFFINGPSHGTPASTSAPISWNVSESTTNTIYYKRGSTGTYTAYSAPDGNQSAYDLSGLEASTTYFYYLRSCDMAGNCNDTSSSPDQFNTAASGSTGTDDSGSGGGGSGGGSSSGLSKSWNSISAGSTAVFSITGTSVDITDIIFKAAQALSKVKITVAKLSAKPSATTSTPSGSVYQYLSITPENITDTKIASATISFRVNTSWITSNLVNASTIALYRYSGGQWNALVTHSTGTSGSYTTYLAETPGFSYFAIAGKLKGASTPAVQTPATPNTTVNLTTVPDENISTTSTTLSSNSTSQNNETVSGEEASSSTTSYLIAFIVIIIVAVVALVFREKLKIKIPEKLKTTLPEFYAGQKTQDSGHKYTFNLSEVKSAQLVYKQQPKEEKVKYAYKPKK